MRGAFERAKEDAEERELRRIGFHKMNGTATWDDRKRETEIRRRQVDREFERQERKRGEP